MTIRTRLTFWYSGLLTLIVVTLSIAVLMLHRLSLMSTIDQFLRQSADKVLQSLSFTGDDQDPQISLSQDSALRIPSVSVQIWRTGEGIPAQLVDASQDMEDVQEPFDPDHLHASTRFEVSHDMRGVPMRILTQPITTPQGVHVGVIQLATSMQTVERFTDTLLLSMVIATTSAILISIGLGIWISGRILKPIERITDTAASIVNANDLSTRIPYEGPMDEIGKLTAVFNQTMERLAHLFSVQQRFVADVSHELRTPLTSILGNIELMQRYGAEPDLMEAAHRETERMTRMVNDLLMLARADNGELKVNRQPTSLDGIVLEVYEQAHLLAGKRPLKIVLGKLEDVRIHGDNDRLKQLVLNLVNNAIKFTPDGGKITLEVYQQAGKGVLVVSDTGIGISEADQKRIFDRFYQADNSRTQRSKSDGAGLGLSIAQWIAQAHEGHIEVHSELGKGTSFRISFPLEAHANAEMPLIINPNTNHHKRPVAQV